MKLRPVLRFKVEKQSFFFSTAIITQLEGWAIYAHPSLMTSVW